MRAIAIIGCAAVVVAVAWSFNWGLGVISSILAWGVIEELER